MNGELDALKSVRYRYKENADLIKITATGGVLSNAKDGQNPQMTLNEIKAVVDAAKEMNINVPLVVRLAGTNFKEGKEILDNSGLKLISAENLDDAAKKIVEAIK